MKKIIDTIEKKFIQSFDINDFEVLTDEGWKDCIAIHKTVPYKIWIVYTKNCILKCADNHIVFDENMQQVFVKDLSIGKKIQTEYGLDEVIQIIKTNEEDNMYDLELANNTNHRYYTNGILSHNTTTYTILLMWMATLFPEKKIMVCANKLQTSIEIMDRLRIAYEYLPKFLKPGIVCYNKQEISFANKSTIRAFATSSSASRGFSAQTVVIDEMAFIPKNVIDEFFASVMPVVSSAKDSKVIVVSTPNGTSGLYYDIWQEANSKERSKNKEGWSPFRVDWFEVPGRTEEWKEKQIASIGIQRWNQEFGNEFQSSSVSAKLIPDDKIEQFRMALSKFKSQNFLPKKQKIVSQDEKQIFEFDMWHEFEPQKTYAASMDIAEGVGQDASVLYIWDVTDLDDIKMCAKYSDNHTSVVQFAYIARKMLALYNDPPLAGERNGVSAGTMDSLRITYGYENIVRENKKNEAGIYSHVTVKEKACQWTKTMTSTRGMSFTIYDKELVDEMGIFCKKDTSGKHVLYAALPGPNSHDDHMMAFIWLTYILNPEIIDKYFIVCQTYADDFGNIYPKILQPMNAYSAESWKKIKDDPLYKDFLEYKEESKKHCKLLQDLEAQENESDGFRYSTHIKSKDAYFGDDDGESWGQGDDISNWKMLDQARWLKEQARLKQKIQAVPAYFI